MDNSLLIQMLTEIKSEQTLMRADITEIKVWQAERRGERRAGLWLFGSASGALGAALTIVAALFAKRI